MAETVTPMMVAEPAKAVMVRCLAVGTHRECAECLHAKPHTRRKPSPGFNKSTCDIQCPHQDDPKAVCAKGDGDA